jgi:hypothetical protein
MADEHEPLWRLDILLFLLFFITRLLCDDGVVKLFLGRGHQFLLLVERDQARALATLGVRQLLLKQGHTILLHGFPFPLCLGRSTAHRVSHHVFRGVRHDEGVALLQKCGACARP